MTMPGFGSSEIAPPSSEASRPQGSARAAGSSVKDDGLATRATSLVGTELAGKYRLDAVLGVGGMATVFRATHRNGRRVAIKLLHAHLSYLQEARERFRREGVAANAVVHPGVVAVLDDDQAEDGSPFLVMELLDGETVEALWERCGRRLPFDTVISLGVALLDVLAAAHAEGVIHRDVKPANLLLAKRGDGDTHLKVLDFGIARVRETAATQVTVAGAAIGTPAFMAPEQALGKPDLIDAQSDLWAAGATLFTLASGQFVHVGETLQEMVIEAATSPARSLGEVAPDLPRAFVEMIDRALSMEKARRWPSAEAMRDALRSGFPVAVVADETIRTPALAWPAPAPSSDAPLLDLGGDHVTGRTATQFGAARSSPPPAAAPRRGRSVVPSIALAAAFAGLAIAAAMFVWSGSRPVPSALVVGSAPPPEPSALRPFAAPPAIAITPDPAGTAAPDPAAVSAAPEPQRPRPATASSAARAAPPTPRCNPPYDLDSRGIKRWRPACL
jgi:serine/threonine-protein kinase